jgi:hypothetical protein
VIRRSIGILLCVLSASTCLVGTATAQACEYRCVSNGQVDGNDGGLNTAIGISGPGLPSGTTPANHPGGGVSTGPFTRYAYTPLCDATCASPELQATSDLANCTAPATAVWVTVEVVGSGVPPTLTGPAECLTPNERPPYDPTEIPAMVANYFEHIPLPEPGLYIAPADNAVVNLPEIVSADAPAVTTFTVNQAPFPVVTINATVQWVWDFGDGTTLVTTSPGKAYDGTDPANGGYVTHTYKTANTAWPLTVTSVWTATYTVQGVGGVQTVISAVRRTTAHPLASAEYGSVLTGN